MNAAPLLSMRGIHLRYGETRALNGVDFDLQHGEIHALIGEHRAGKSSLVKILSGAAKIFSGTIAIDGRRIEQFSPQSALKAGIGIVYQDLTVIPDLNALENIFTGHMFTSRFQTLDHSGMRTKAEELFSWIGTDFNAEVPIYKLPAAQQHMIEFARACSIEPKILILDELSNKLTPAEMKKIYRAVMDLKSRGVGIIYISHDMDEILRLADRVTILKDGHRRGTEHVRNLDKYRLYQLTYTFTLNQEQMEDGESKFVVVKRYLENLVHELSAGIIVLDAKSDIQIFNFAASELLGFDTEFEAGRSWESILRDTSLENVDEVLSAIDAREPRQWDSLPMPPGKSLRVHIHPLLDDEETFIGTTIILEDQSLAASLNEYVVQSEKVASVAEVAVGVAHEINNPLFIVKNYLELVKQKNENPEIAGKIEKIEKELGRIVEIVSSLLSFSRRPTGVVGANVDQVIDELIPLLDHRFSEKSVKVDRDSDRNRDHARCTVQMDENRLKQVLINLLMNSLDAVLDQGRVSIHTSRDTETDQVVIRIRDDGYGIPDDVAANIFRPFFTTKVGKRSTGLGLSICRHLVEGHGGTIAFESRPGEGTEFTVRLKAAEG